MNAKERKAQSLLRKRLRNKTYYETHKDELREKALNHYDPEKRRIYYAENRDAILERERVLHKKHKTNAKLERLKALQDIVSNEGVLTLIKELILKVDSITLGDVSTLEKSILLGKNTSTPL